MDIIDRLISFFQKPEENTKNETPEGLCPVCWGYQQYDGKIRVLIKDRQIDINNHVITRPFFEEVIAKHVDGIKLKEAVTIPCPDCNNLADENNSKEEQPNPIKRIKELQPLSREHHYGLLVCWKIRQGIKKNIAHERIKKYTNWFWDKHLQHHFEIEEGYVFPILGNKNSLIIQAKNEHQQLKKLFEEQTVLSNSLNQLEQDLQKHIRFEERVIFNEIQKVATKDEIELIAVAHTSNFKDDYEDEFWL